MHVVGSVVAKEQLNREVSEPVQVTPCKYIGFRFSLKPPLPAMAPEIQSVDTLLTMHWNLSVQQLQNFDSINKNKFTMGRMA